MKDIFVRLLGQLTDRQDSMLVTMVAHAGSVPRGMGSQMLLSAQGRIAGTIGGGVGEKEMVRRGLEMLKEKQSGLSTYALHGSADERIGSVCGGDITVYFQYIPGGDAFLQELTQKLLESIQGRSAGWLILRLDGGLPALLGEDGVPLCGERPEESSALCRPFSVRTETCFSMPLYVGERAVIFGAGHCAQALTPLLSSVGFRVTVYDDRPQYADRALFPQAERTICAPFDCIDDHVTLDEEDYIVAMSSTHASDLSVMKQALQSPHAYIGMIGSKPKRAFVFGKLLEYGIPQERIDGVHSPIGLNIRAVTPAEIAVSIAGEMVLVRAENRGRKKGD